MIQGKISLPGDKSISHRAALFAAIKPGLSRFENFNTNQDCVSTVACLSMLGVDTKVDGTTLLVEGKSIEHWRQPDKPLDAGNSGTTSRLISGMLSGLSFETEMVGDPSLSRRPMSRIVEPLSLMGAKIESANGYLPLRFLPVEKLKAISYNLPVASAQVKSAVLLAGLFAEGKTTVIEQETSRDHTERMLNLPTKRRKDGGMEISSQKGHPIPELSMKIPGDISSACFFISAALAIKNSKVTIENVSLNPTRTAILDLLRRMGGKITIEKTSAIPEPAGNITAEFATLRNLFVPIELIPNIIDEIPILAVLATRARGEMKIKGAKELRVKESDRIRSIVDNLRACDIEIEEYEDGFSINGPQEFKGAQIKTHGDHRIAMAFSIAQLFTSQTLTIDNPQCAAVSFPGFYKTLESLRK